DLIRYQPFARGGDLCLVFAEVTGPDQLLRFINNYGPLNDYYSRLHGADWEDGESNLGLSSPNPVSVITRTGTEPYWRCEDGTWIPADFIPGDPVPDCLEPISKSPEEDNEASELYEAEEVVGVVFPTDEDAALPLNPSKEALHEPTSHIAA